MDKTIYQTLTVKNFNLDSLDEFIRRQDVRECWRRADGSLTLLPIAYIEDWNLQQRRETAKEIQRTGSRRPGLWRVLRKQSRRICCFIPCSLRKREAVYGLSPFLCVGAFSAEGNR